VTALRRAEQDAMVSHLVYALSRATLVVAADAGAGGTWAGAVEALRQQTTPVLAWSPRAPAPATGSWWNAAPSQPPASQRCSRSVLAWRR
jgi:hypothetical protein